MHRRLDLEKLAASVSGKEIRTRFAPSPTGYLHLGHVVNAIYVWGIAGALGGKVILRLENHDRVRCKAEYEQTLLDDLDWLGFVPDFGKTDEFREGKCIHRQSDLDERYEGAFLKLKKEGLIYACDCSRKSLQARTGQAQAEEMAYDGHCRKRNLPFSAQHSIRLVLPEKEVTFFDHLEGLQIQNPAEQCGDIIIKDNHGNWSYQFCVSIDDIHDNINLIIRGMDILNSSGRQIILKQILEPKFDHEVQYLHHGLLTDENGRKLSKRDFDADIQTLRKSGIDASIVLGKAAFLAGLQDDERPIFAKDAKNLFI